MNEPHVGCKRPGLHDRTDGRPPALAIAHQHLDAAQGGDQVAGPLLCGAVCALELGEPLTD
jgi:hypothetical protein